MMARACVEGPRACRRDHPPTAREVAVSEARPPPVKPREHSGAGGNIIRRRARPSSCCSTRLRWITSSARCPASTTSSNPARTSVRSGVSPAILRRQLLAFMMMAVRGWRTSCAKEEAIACSDVFRSVMSMSMPMTRTGRPSSAHRRTACEEPAGAPVTVHQAVLELVTGAPALQMLAHARHHGWRIVGMHQLQPVVEVIPDLVVLVSEDRLERRIVVKRAGSEVPIPDARPGRSGGHGVAPLAIPERDVRLPAACPLDDQRDDHQRLQHHHGGSADDEPAIHVHDRGIRSRRDSTAEQVGSGSIRAAPCRHLCCHVKQRWRDSSFHANQPNLDHVARCAVDLCTRSTSANMEC